MGSREKINSIRELIQTGQATMQIDAPNPDIPQDLVIDDPDYLLISNLGTALLAASLYYTVTNDHTLIEKLMQYIEINNVDVNRCEGTLLHMAIAQGKPCENFVLFLLEKRHFICFHPCAINSFFITFTTLKKQSQTFSLGVRIV